MTSLTMPPRAGSEPSVSASLARSVTDSRPPSASTRSASPRSPDPFRLAPPRPSSTIRATTAPWSTVIATDARVALACLAMLVRASAQTK